MKHASNIRGTIILTLVLASPASQAGLSDYLDSVRESVTGAGGGEAAAALSDDEMVAGLKEALSEQQEGAHPHA
jgi:hypothetical protein